MERIWSSVCFALMLLVRIVSEDICMSAGKMGPRCKISLRLTGWHHKTSVDCHQNPEVASMAFLDQDPLVCGEFPLERRPKPQPKMAICSARIQSLTSSNECGFTLVFSHPRSKKGGVSLKNMVLECAKFISHRRKENMVLECAKFHVAHLGLCHSHVHHWQDTSRPGT